MSRIVKAPTGSELTCKNWLIEAAYRMIQNNLDAEVAFDPENLIVYGRARKSGAELGMLRRDLAIFARAKRGRDAAHSVGQLGQP